MAGERVAIIGGGVMGTNHARTLASIEGVSLSHVIDADVARATKLAELFGDELTRPVDTITNIDKDTTDAAIIVSPSHYHESQAIELMQKGLHVLIEKPVAESAAGAMRLHRAAAKMGVVAIAGHVELFNPTVNSLVALLADENIKEMTFRRMGSVPDKSRLYHDVVSDLMIHDIAIALKILEEKSLSTDGTIVSAIGRKDTIAWPDPAQASIRFADVDTHFRASRSYPAGKVRDIVVETEDKIFSADLLERSVTATSATSPSFTTDGVLVDDTHNIRYFPSDLQSPLTAEQKFFLDCIRGRSNPEDGNVSMLHARRTLLLTRAVLDTIN